MSELAIITGGSKGLGKALVEKWLEEGWNVATCARTIAPMESLKHERLLIRAVDVSDFNAVNSFCHAAISRFGAPEVLINNASVLGPRSPIAEYPVDAWHEVVDINLTGTFNFLRCLSPVFRNQRRGVILNISSGAGVTGKARWGAYAASKFGVEGLTQVLRDELQDDHVRIHAIDPGAMRTQMRADAYPDEDPLTLPTPEQIARVIFDIAVVYEPTLARLKARDYL